MILTSVRHVKSVAEFTEEEQQDFLKSLIAIRKAQKKCLGIDVVYLVQEEDTSAHFHVWIFPRLTWMDELGKKIQSVRPIMEYAREHLKTPEQIALVDEAVEKLTKELRD